MDIRTSLAQQTYANARPATRPAVESGGADSGFGKVAAEFATTLRQGESAAMAAMTGGADAHSLVQALAASELAVETAVTVRDKVVEAYQEILRMPV